MLASPFSVRLAACNANEACKAFSRLTLFKVFFFLKRTKLTFVNVNIIATTRVLAGAEEAGK